MNRKELSPSTHALTVVLLCCAYVIGLSGCATPIERNPLPADKATSATVTGMRDVGALRAPRGALAASAQEDIIQTARDDVPGNYRRNPDGSRAYDVLALSGGGWNGAFGAGILSGWSETGTRPTFKIVTGVSTGALIAPFAYLGPEYDATMERAYTTLEGAKQIYREKGLLEVLGGASLTDNKPLVRLIETFVDEAVLEAVAREHRRGRRLLIGTTNLDAGELVVWNMGEIANSGHPEALELFRKVLLASASIPVIMPPVLIEVEVDGERYDEMHVDGNTTNSAFFHGGVIDLVDVREQLARDGIQVRGEQVYIIENGRLVRSFEQVEPTLEGIATRSVDTLTQSIRLGDLYRMYLRAQRNKVGFNFVTIPDGDEPVSKEPFNQEEMIRLFELGFRLGKSGTAWQETPPGAGLLR